MRRKSKQPYTYVGNVFKNCTKGKIYTVYRGHKIMPYIYDDTMHIFNICPWDSTKWVAYPPNTIGKKLNPLQQAAEWVRERMNPNGNAVHRNHR